MRNAEERYFFLWRKLFWACAIVQVFFLVIVFTLSLWLNSSPFDKYFSVLETIAGLLLLLFGSHGIFFVLSKRLLVFSVAGIFYGCILLSIIIVTQVITLSEKEAEREKSDDHHPHYWWITYEVTVVINIIYCIFLFIGCIIANKLRIVILSLTSRMYRRRRRTTDSVATTEVDGEGYCKQRSRNETVNSTGKGDKYINDSFNENNPDAGYIPPFYKKIPKKASGSLNNLRIPLFNTNKYVNEEDSEFSSFGNAVPKLLVSNEKTSDTEMETSSKRPSGDVDETPNFNLFNSSSSSLDLPASCRQDNDLNCSQGSGEFECIDRSTRI